MAQTTLLLNGFSIIGDPKSNTAAAGGGRLLIKSGTAVFEGDDIIVFHVEGADPDGGLNANSVITGITVYDTAIDYYYDTPLYTYAGPAPGAGADLDTGRNNMGDRYLQFNASALTSTDPGAPVLDDMTVLAGVDILGTLATQSGPIKIDTIEDLDLDGDGSIDGVEVGDGTFDDEVNLLTVICFARGTLIETPDGPRPVETLEEGDIVNTLDAGPQEVRWAGKRTCAAQSKHAPIRIAPGALGNVRTLWVSPNHRMLVTGAKAELLFGAHEVLVAAKHLVNDSTIRRDPRACIDYHHVLLDAHHILFAEGCGAESLFPGPEALEAISPDNRDTLVSLFPELKDDRPGIALARPSLGAYEATILRDVA